MKPFTLKNLALALLGTAVFVFFLVAVLPQEAAKGAAMGLVDSIDSAFFYSPERLYAIAAAYGAEGRAFYIQQRFSFDVIWPLAYGFFVFSWLNLWLRSKRWVLLLSWVPVGFDFLENISAAFVLSRFPERVNGVAWMASVFTPLKWLTLYSALTLVLALFVVGPIWHGHQRQKTR
jgi:hypothetical protein